MTVITITTVGYGEHIHLSEKGRIFTIVLALTGSGMFFYILANLGEVAIKKLSEDLWGKTKERKIQKLENHCIICGFGRIGKHIYEFIRDKINVVVIDNNPKIIKLLERKKILYVEGQAFSEEVLLKAGIKRAKYLVSVVGQDADNVFICLTARNLNPDIYIVAKADDPKVGKKLMQAGANKVVSPYIIGAKKMALSILKPNVTDFMEIASPEANFNLQIEEIMVTSNSPLIGKTLLESKIRQYTNAIILAIKRQNGEMIFNPTPKTEILEGDTLIVLGQSQDLDILDKMARGESL